VLHNFDWLFFHYFLQLTSAAKSNEKFVNQKLCKTILILVWISWFFSLNLSFSPFTMAVMKRIYVVMFIQKHLKSHFLQYTKPVHTGIFDWFLSGLELILNLEFCLLKLLIFYQKLSWNIRSRLNPSTTWVLSLYLNMLDQKLHFLCTKLQFWSNLSKNWHKTQNVEELSLDLIFHNNFW
jgi:hypothetical protein